MTTRLSLLSLLTAALLFGASGAHAEFELSLYTGYQTAPHSVVEGEDPGGLGDYKFTAGWEGRSNEMPPYYGFRGTWWKTDELGFGIEFNHAKVYADDETLRDNGIERLEFSDGLNLLTVNVMRRFQDETGGRVWTPYVGAGVGVSIPHVELTTGGGKTFDYQYGGPAVQWIAGVSYPINDQWNVFGEYKGSYSQNDVDLDNGGTLETNIVTNALNVGVSFNF